MKILHYIGVIDKSSGGVIAYLQTLEENLSSDYELVIVAGKTENPVTFKKAKTILVDTSLLQLRKLKSIFRDILTTEKPDLVHINGIWLPDISIFQNVAKDLKYPVLLSPHGMLAPFILNRNPLKKKIALLLYQKKALKDADYLHATSLMESEQIKNLGFNQFCSVVANGVNMQEVQTKKSFTQTKKFLIMSRLDPQKGHEMLIDALALIKNKLNDWQLIIAGAGKDEYINLLNEKINNLGLNKNVVLVGGVYGEEKWKLFQNVDFFVLPSYSECFGIAIAEALAVGIPVITTKGRPWQELETYDCGWWIDLTIEDLSKTIAEAIACSPQRLQTMGENGRKLIEEKYRIETVSNNMKMFYEWILNTKSEKPSFIN